MLNYVLNVQPSDHLITEVLALARHMLKDNGQVLIAIRNDLGQDQSTSRGVQQVKSVAEWRSFVEPIFSEVKTLKEKGDFIALVARP